jgi:hypothetical protein
MATAPRGIYPIENPTGNGWVYKGKELIGEVSYALQVFHNLTYNKTSAKILVTGKIKAINGPDILWVLSISEIGHFINRRLFHYEVALASCSRFRL